MPDTRVYVIPQFIVLQLCRGPFEMQNLIFKAEKLKLKKFRHDKF